MPAKYSSLALLLATLAACEPAQDLPARAQQPSAAEPVAQLRFYAARPLHELSGSAARRVDSLKARALGIVYSQSEGTLPAELTIVNDTAGEMQTLARVRFFAAADGGWSDTIFVREPMLYGGLERATHDDYGLQAARVSENWAQVNFAYDSTGRARQGWIRLVRDRVIYSDYDSQLFEYSTHFYDEAAATFFDRPNGVRLSVDLSPSHALRVLDLKGDWIQVVLTVPDTAECGGDPAAKVQRRDTVWVPRLNTQGRRQIFAATAGC